MLSLLAAALLVAAAAGSLAWSPKLRAEAERSQLNVEIIHTASGEPEHLDRVRLSGIAAGGDTAAQLREFTSQGDRVAQLLRGLRGGDEAGLADLRSALAHYVADGARQLQLVYRGYPDAARLIEVDEVRPTYARLSSAFADADSRFDSDELLSQRLAHRISLALLAAVILAYRRRRCAFRRHAAPRPCPGRGAGPQRVAVVSARPARLRPGRADRERRPDLRRQRVGRATPTDSPRPSCSVESSSSLSTGNTVNS